MDINKETTSGEQDINVYIDEASRVSALDLYEDLLVVDNVQGNCLTIEEINLEKQQLKQQNELLMQQLSQATANLRNITKENTSLKNNFTSLLSTAKTELERKNKVIARLSGAPEIRPTNASHQSPSLKPNPRNTASLKGKRVDEPHRNFQDESFLKDQPEKLVQSKERQQRQVVSDNQLKRKHSQVPVHNLVAKRLRAEEQEIHNPTSNATNASLPIPTEPGLDPLRNQERRTDLKESSSERLKTGSSGQITGSYKDHRERKDLQRRSEYSRSSNRENNSRGKRNTPETRVSASDVRSKHSAERDRRSSSGKQHSGSRERSEYEADKSYRSRQVHASTKLYPEKEKDSTSKTLEKLQNMSEEKSRYDNKGKYRQRSPHSAGRERNDKNSKASRDIPRDPRMRNKATHESERRDKRPQKSSQQTDSVQPYSGDQLGRSKSRSSERAGVDLRDKLKSRGQPKPQKDHNSNTTENQLPKGNLQSKRDRYYSVETFNTTQTCLSTEVQDSEKQQDADGSKEQQSSNLNTQDVMNIIRAIEEPLIQQADSSTDGNPTNFTSMEITKDTVTSTAQTNPLSLNLSVADRNNGTNDTTGIEMNKKSQETRTGSAFDIQSLDIYDQLDFNEDSQGVPMLQSPAKVTMVADRQNSNLETLQDRNSINPRRQTPLLELPVEQVKKRRADLISQNPVPSKTIHKPSAKKVTPSKPKTPENKSKPEKSTPYRLLPKPHLLSMPEKGSNLTTDKTKPPSKSPVLTNQRKTPLKTGKCADISNSNSKTMDKGLCISKSSNVLPKPIQRELLNPNSTKSPEKVKPVALRKSPRLQKKQLSLLQPTSHSNVTKASLSERFAKEKPNCTQQKSSTTAAIVHSQDKMACVAKETQSVSTAANKKVHRDVENNQGSTQKKGGHLGSPTREKNTTQGSVRTQVGKETTLVTFDKYQVVNSKQSTGQKKKDKLCSPTRKSSKKRRSTSNTEVTEGSVAKKCVDSSRKTKKHATLVNSDNAETNSQQSRPTLESSKTFSASSTSRQRENQVTPNKLTSNQTHLFSPEKVKQTDSKRKKTKSVTPKHKRPATSPLLKDNETFTSPTSEHRHSDTIVATNCKTPKGHIRVIKGQTPEGVEKMAMAKNRRVEEIKKRKSPVKPVPKNIGTVKALAPLGGGESFMHYYRNASLQCLLHLAKKRATDRSQTNSPKETTQPSKATTKGRDLWLTSLEECQQRRKLKSRWMSERLDEGSGGPQHRNQNSLEPQPVATGILPQSETAPATSHGSISWTNHEASMCRFFGLADVARILSPIKLTPSRQETNYDVSHSTLKKATRQVFAKSPKKKVRKK